MPVIITTCLVLALSVELAAGKGLAYGCPPCNCHPPLGALEVAAASVGFIDPNAGGMVPTLLPETAAFLSTTAVTTPIMAILPMTTPSMLAMMTPAAVTALPISLMPSDPIVPGLSPAPCADQGELDAMQAQIEQLKQIINDQNQANAPAPAPQPPGEFAPFPELPHQPPPPPPLPDLPEVDPSLAAAYATVPPDSPYRGAGSPVPASASIAGLQLHASQNSHLVKAKEIVFEPPVNRCSCPCRQEQSLQLRLRKASSSAGFLAPKKE